MKRTTLTAEEAVFLLDQIPSIFPSAAEVQSILDQVERSVLLDGQQSETTKIFDWWRGWVAADCQLKFEIGDRFDVLTLLANTINNQTQIGSPVGRAIWRSGFRTRVSLNSKIYNRR